MNQVFKTIIWNNFYHTKCPDLKLLYKKCNLQAKEKRVKFLLFIIVSLHILYNFELRLSFSIKYQRTSFAAKPNIAERQLRIPRGWRLYTKSQIMRFGSCVSRKIFYYQYVNDNGNKIIGSCAHTNLAIRSLLSRHVIK